jgi:phosphate transport system substrate-binding protein
MATYLVALVALGLSGCGSDNPFGDEAFTTIPGGDSGLNLTGQFVGAGASTQQSAMEAWIARFQDQHPGISVV